MSSFEKKLLNFLESYLDKIVFIVVILLSVWLRRLYTPLVDITNGASDYKSELSVWVDYYRGLSVKECLSNGIGNYYVPYNLLLILASRFDIEAYWFICIFSYVFDYVMAFYIYKIVMLLMGYEGDRSSLEAKSIKVVAAISLILPMVVANSAIWKQCDSVYSGIILCGIYYFLKKKYNAAFIILGVAFSFKMQTILILPFLLIAYFVLREFSVLKFMWIPGIYAIAGLPAIICGARITRVYGTYYRQTKQYGAMTINSPGIWNLGLSEYMYHHVAMAITIIIFAVLVLAITVKKPKWNDRLFFYLLGWGVMTCFEFLPSMHERYDYLAIIVLTYVAIYFRHRILPAVIGMHLVSACTYGKFLFGFDVDYTLVAIVYLMAYLFISWDFVGQLFENER